MDWPRRVIVNLSGGIDSSYCLYLALQAGCDVLVHHIVLKNHEGRHDVESRAVAEIMRWLGAQGLPGRMTYVESRTDYGTIPRIIADHWLWMYWTGVLLRDRARNGDRAVVISSHIGDTILTNPARWRDLRALVRAMAPEPQWLFPLSPMTKAQVIQAIPRDLLWRCWWCRKPKHGNQPCHACITCKVVDPALQALGLEPPLPAGEPASKAASGADQPAEDGALVSTDELRRMAMLRGVPRAETLTRSELLFALAEG